MPEKINHPPHYNTLPATCDECGASIECIEVVRHMNFNLGNVVKYVWRAKQKGDPIEDLKKAKWYLEDEISKLEKHLNGIEEKISSAAENLDDKRFFEGAVKK